MKAAFFNYILDSYQFVLLLFEQSYLHIVVRVLRHECAVFLGQFGDPMRQLVDLYMINPQDVHTLHGKENGFSLLSRCNLSLNVMKV